MLRMPAVAVAARVELSLSRLNVPDAERRAEGDAVGTVAALVPWIRIAASWFVRASSRPRG
jgi:hypothetical protein